LGKQVELDHSHTLQITDQYGSFSYQSLNDLVTATRRRTRDTDHP